MRKIYLAHSSCTDTIYDTVVEEPSAMAIGNIDGVLVQRWYFRQEISSEYILRGLENDPYDE